MDDLLRDLRYGARRLARRRLFTAVAVLTIALAVGANTAIFSVVHGVLLRPLSVVDDEALVALWKYDPERDFDHFPILFEEFRRWRDENRSFSGLAALTSEGVWTLPMEPVSADDEPTLIRVAPVSAGFVAVAGVSPVQGRAFASGDETPGEVRSGVLSHAAWVRRFGSSPGVLGSTLTVNGQPHQVVGIMPPGFDFPAGTELWACLKEDSRAELEALGRLRPGTDRGAARAEIETLAHRFADERAPWLRDKVVVATPLRDSLVGGVRRPLLVLLGATGLLLAIASANVAHLLLVEATARRRQLAIRGALGAPRGRLLRQLLTESGLLAALGGIAGVALAVAALGALRHLRPAALPRLGEIGLHGPVLGFSLLVVTLATLAFGLAPALHATRPETSAALRVGATGPDRRQSSLSRVLAVAEIALAMVLLVGAGLLLRSFVEHLRLDRGFSGESLVSVTLKVPAPQRGRDKLLPLYDALLPRLESLPGVTAASPMLNRPFATTDGYNGTPAIEGKPPEETADLPWANLEAVAPSFVETLDVRVEQGRFFTLHDQAASLPVAVVNRALAARYWPGEDPIGRRLSLFEADGWRTVVGVVSDLRLRDPTEVQLDLYLPLAQSPWAPHHLAVRTASGPEGVAAGLRQEIRRLLPGAVVEITPVTALLAAELSAPRFNALGVTLFAALALGLAAVGIYGVMASLVAGRRTEIGVRMALGADGRQVLGWMLGHGLKLALAGVVAGVGVALALTRLMTTLLFRTSPFDPATFAVLALFLLAVAGAAVLIPARRAAGLDSWTVLRQGSHL